MTTSSTEREQWLSEFGKTIEQELHELDKGTALLATNVALNDNRHMIQRRFAYFRADFLGIIFA